MSLLFTLLMVPSASDLSRQHQQGKCTNEHVRDNKAYHAVPRNVVQHVEAELPQRRARCAARLQSGGRGIASGLCAQHGLKHQQPTNTGIAAGESCQPAGRRAPEAGAPLLHQRAEADQVAGGHGTEAKATCQQARGCHGGSPGTRHRHPAARSAWHGLREMATCWGFGAGLRAMSTAPEGRQAPYCTASGLCRLSYTLPCRPPYGPFDHGPLDR